MKKATLYIHIGTYKTGSTAIQKAIRNSSSLKKEKISDIGRPPYFREICTTNKIEEKFIRKGRQEISKRIKRERFFGRNTFVVSAEHFSGNPNNGFHNSAIVAKILKKITEPLDLDVKIIVYLRRQDEFIQSLYTQEIHHGRSLSFKQYIGGFDEHSFDWNRLLINYSANFGEENLIVRRYGKKYMPEENSLVRDFGEIIGSETLKNYSKTSLSNRGYSRDALEIARRCNSLLDSQEKSILRNLLQSISSKQPFDKYNYFDLNEKRAFLKRYEESNKKVAEIYFNETNLFEKPSLTIKSELYGGLDKDIIIDHLVSIVKEINTSQSNKKNRGTKSNKHQLFEKIFSKFPSLKQNVRLLLGKYY